MFLILYDRSLGVPARILAITLRCTIPVVFKLYGEVNSVKKNTTINIWLNGVY